MEGQRQSALAQVIRMSPLQGSDIALDLQKLGPRRLKRLPGPCRPADMDRSGAVTPGVQRSIDRRPVVPWKGCQRAASDLDGLGPK